MRLGNKNVIRANHMISLNTSSTTDPRLLNLVKTWSDWLVTIITLVIMIGVFQINKIKLNIDRERGKIPRITDCFITFNDEITGCPGNISAMSEIYNCSHDAVSNKTLLTSSFKFPKGSKLWCRVTICGEKDFGKNYRSLVSMGNVWILSEICIRT